jgi:hypothetical protein
MTQNRYSRDYGQETRPFQITNYNCHMFPYVWSKECARQMQTRPCSLTMCQCARKYGGRAQDDGFKRF